MAKFKVLNKVTRRRALKVLGSAGAASITTAVGIPRVFAQDKSPIKIGVVLPLSGAYAAQGTAGAQGIQLLAEQTNAKGGLLGRQIQVLVEDFAAQTANGRRKGDQADPAGWVQILNG